MIFYGFRVIQTILDKPTPKGWPCKRSINPIWLQNSCKSSPISFPHNLASGFQQLGMWSHITKNDFGKLQQNEVDVMVVPSTKMTWTKPYPRFPTHRNSVSHSGVTTGSQRKRNHHSKHREHLKEVWHGCLCREWECLAYQDFKSKTSSKYLIYSLVILDHSHLTYTNSCSFW